MSAVIAVSYCRHVRCFKSSSGMQRVRVQRFRFEDRLVLTYVGQVTGVWQAGAFLALAKCLPCVYFFGLPAWGFPEVCRFSELKIYNIVVSIFFSIIPIYPQYSIVVSIRFSIIPYIPQSFSGSRAPEAFF